MTLTKWLRLSLEQVHWGGGIALALSAVGAICILLGRTPLSVELPIALSSRAPLAPPVDFKLALPAWTPQPMMQEARQQMTFCLEPARPDRAGAAPQLAVHFPHTSVHAALPARIGLAWSEQGLTAMPTNALFWLELAEGSAKLCVRSPDSDQIESVSWGLEPGISPLQTTFPESSCFRQLAEAKWGLDVAIEQLSHENPVYLTETLAVAPGEWLVFQDARWQPLETLEAAQGRPIAHLLGKSGQALELEGWDDTNYIRFAPTLVAVPPLRIRPEELMPQLRIRSDKQISCTLDKQSVILSVGDWAIKREQRWTVLRTPQDKERALNGELGGDLFVLDRIDGTGPARSIAGRYFAANRLQSMHVERTPERRTKVRR